MHRSESGSGSQAGQEAGSSSVGGHGQREQDPYDLPALNYDVHGMEYLVGPYRVTCSVHSSLQVWPFMTPHLQD